MVLSKFPVEEFDLADLDNAYIVGKVQDHVHRLKVGQICTALAIITRLGMPWNSITPNASRKLSDNADKSRAIRTPKVCDTTEMAATYRDGPADAER